MLSFLMLNNMLQFTVKKENDKEKEREKEKEKRTTISEDSNNNTLYLWELLPCVIKPH